MLVQMGGKIYYGIHWALTRAIRKALSLDMSSTCKEAMMTTYRAGHSIQHTPARNSCPFAFSYQKYVCICDLIKQLGAEKLTSTIGVLTFYI